jgi:hypothetical protein
MAKGGLLTTARGFAGSYGDLSTATVVYAGGRGVFAGGNMGEPPAKGELPVALLPSVVPRCLSVALLLLPVAPPFALDASASLDTDIS